MSKIMSFSSNPIQDLLRYSLDAVQGRARTLVRPLRLLSIEDEPP
jgi:hypothetical protein